MNKLYMSDDMTQLVNQLTFDGNIDQGLYESLEHSEKLMFFKLLKLTHLYHSKKQPLEDPNKRLIAEWNKLRGEFEIGNNHPDLLKELKLLTFDLYQNKLIKANEFRNIMATI